MKEASSQNAKKCIIIRSKITQGQVSVKDMDTGVQEEVDVERLFANLGS